MVYKALHRKLMIEQYEPHWKPCVNSSAPEVLAGAAPLVVPIVLNNSNTNIIWHTRIVLDTNMHKWTQWI
jgi:hypothetical protein